MAENPPAFPSKAEFSLSPYDDGSGHRIVVAYDASDRGQFGREVRIGTDYYNTFPPEDAEAVIAAIRYCADALLAERAKEQQP